jgi:hypothetical protein
MIQRLLLKIRHGQKGTFLIDTGALELHIMPAFAEKCGIKPLDYPAGKLILARFPRAVPSKPLTERESEGLFNIPFWLAGDHFIYARGTANGSGPYLFLVDTGMAGGGFDCPNSVMDEAKIELSKEGFQGMGGGGKITVYPFTVNLTLGKARRDNVRGLHGAIAPDFEYRTGFRMGGIISHGFFRSFAVTFDFQTMTISLKG